MMRFGRWMMGLWLCVSAAHALTLWPDYSGITVPPNIAPLNFELAGTPAQVTTILQGAHGALRCEGREVSWQEAEWKAFLAAHQGQDYTLTVTTGDTVLFCATNHVSTQPIDPTLVYRLIPPSYEGYAEMGIYFRDLTSFVEKPLFLNSQAGAEKRQCVNCHSFCNRDPDTLSLHLRAVNGGTVIYRGKDDPGRKCNFKVGPMISSCVYPAWHPAGRHIVYSVNDTAQNFYTANLDKIEVIDSQSDLAIYDLDKDTLRLIERDPKVFETFPTWAPDGKTLYTCVATVPFEIDAEKSKRFATVIQAYTNMHYNLVQRTFDAKTGQFGEPQLVIDAAVSGRSVIHPRVSPNGRWLLITVAPYGTFHIWHSQADLYLIDLQKRSMRAMDELNSSNVESYHTFSSNGAWIVFSSRRDDGCYTRPYFAAFDEETGRASKPFIIPVRRPAEQLSRLFSYNVPEFVAGPITRSMRALRELSETSAKAVQFQE